MNITRNDWWATPVWEIQTDFDTNFNKQLLQEVESYYKNLPAGSGANIWNHSGECLDTLRITTLKIIKEQTYDYVAPNFDGMTFEYWHSRGWVNRNETGNGLNLHGHGNPKIAMTYYIDAPTHGGDLIIVDPRGGVDWDMGMDGCNGSKFKRVTPTTGKLVFFPGFLIHGVEENKSYRPRISLSSNMTVVDKPTFDRMTELQKQGVCL
jgi:hypothetical protein